jgi:hypothetical protein
MAGIPKLKIAVIVDGGHVQRFARDVVDAVRDCDEITILSCTNTRFRRNALRHAGYYALNLAALRNPLTRPVPIAGSSKLIVETVDFQSGWDGAWQTLPDEIVARITDGGFDVVLKFGMGLLRIPPEQRLPVPILSYHHGDPDHYRGRPAGFWETLEGAPVMGQIVQILANRLDAGKVVAFAETRVLPHSYRGTLIESYRHSPLLINEAIRNAVARSALPKVSGGRNYRLPSNLQVLRFLAGMVLSYVRRLFYGALSEKTWDVSVAPLEAEVTAMLADGSFPPPSAWRTLKKPRQYVFYADPFFSDDPEGILVEALNRRTGAGEIVLVTGEDDRRVSPGGGHFSYPGTLATAEGQLIVPEIAQWSAPKAYRLEGGVMRDAGALRVEGGARIADPTLIEEGGWTYLFGSPSDLGTNVLWLWVARSVGDVFRPHPMNPLRISPRGSRMAGGLIRTGRRLIRLGQSFERSYGDGLYAFEVLELTPERYAEAPIGQIRFRDRRGPHTLNLREGEMVFDWYRDRLAPLAGVRRLRARLRRRSTGRPLAAPGQGRK